MSTEEATTGDEGTGNAAYQEPNEAENEDFSGAEGNEGVDGPDENAEGVGEEEGHDEEDEGGGTENAETEEEVQPQQEAATDKQQEEFGAETSKGVHEESTAYLDDSNGSNQHQESSKANHEGDAYKSSEKDKDGTSNNQNQQKSEPVVSETGGSSAQRKEKTPRESGKKKNSPYAPQRGNRQSQSQSKQKPQQQASSASVNAQCKTARGQRPPRVERGAMASEMLLAQQPMIGMGGSQHDNVAAQQLQATKENEGKMHQQLAEWQAANVSSLKRTNLQLRKQYDELRMENTTKQKQMQEISTELTSKEKMLAVEKGYDRSNMEAFRKQRETEEKLDEVTKQSEEAMRSKDMYEHMKDRLKNETKDLDVQLDKLNDEKRSLDGQLSSLKQQTQSASQERNRAEKLVTQLRQHLEASRSSRQRHWNQINNQLHAQSSLNQSMTSREIKAPKNNVDQAHRERLKHLYMARKVYGTLLLRKIQDDQRRIDRLETAFQRIRSATGLEDVDEIVEKFQSREGVENILQWSEKAAREKISSLRDERVRLIWQLDDAQTKTEGSTQPRSLYTQLEDIQRRLALQKRHLTESKEKSQRNLVLLEEVQACILKLLNRLETAEKINESDAVSDLGDEDHKTQSSSLPGAGRSAEDEPLKNEKGEYKIDVAIAQLETKISRVLAHLAAVFEREEQAVSREGSNQESGGQSKSSQVAAALGIITGKTSSRDETKDDSQQEESGGKENAIRGAPAQVVAALADMKPAQGAENVRVSPRMMEEKPPQCLQSHSGKEVDESGDESEEEGSEEMEYTEGFAPNAQATTVLEQLHDRDSKNGIVVDRRSLKRLAAMLTDSKRGARLRQAAASHHG